MRVITTSLCLLVATPLAAEFAANDISILMAPPVVEDDPRMELPESSISSELAATASEVIAGVNAMDLGVDAVDTALLTEKRANWHIASLRVDPAAPGAGEAFHPFGRNLQIRLVVQPVTFGGGAPLTDEAIHLVYTFGTAARTASCPFRVLASDEDRAAFQAALDDLEALKATLADLGVETDGAPLGVHPAFANPAAAEVLADQLGVFVERHLTEDRLTALSVAGLPVGAPEPWIFLALDRTEDGFAPVPSPAVGQPAFGQMLSFDPSRGHQDGAVIPPGLTRNLLPVDCMANFIPGVTPDAESGVSTSTLFGAGANDAGTAAEIAAVIADPTQAHFFNTDCVSCHTETRREMDADPSAAARIAAEEHIDPAALPGSPTGFPHWNVRAFGWFPGFPATSGQAQATVVRRTARETEEALEVLNDASWKAVATEPETMDQGWSEGIRRAFYHTSQGGEIMPLTWFLALERPGEDQTLFSDPKSMDRYGALPSPQDAANPHGLPVGFAVTGTGAGTGAGAQVGLNCAACHSANVIAGETVLRIEGAPAAFDFDRFTADLAATMNETAQLLPTGDPAPKLSRFLRNLALVDPEALANPEALVGEILVFATDFAGRMALRNPAYPSGPGRVDALTQIVNSIAVKDLGLPTNLATPKAPTSYPPLWLADQLEYVQWNMAAADPLARNVGQALGVFGTTDLSDFSSSADLAALELYESWIADLEAPAWPANLLGPIDTDLAEMGRDLFLAQCESCHNAPNYRMTSPADNANGDAFIAVLAIPSEEVGTDPAYTAAFTQRWSATGALEPVFERPVLPSALLLGTVVNQVTDKLRAEGGSQLVPRKRPATHPDCGEGAEEPCGYRVPMQGGALKAGPLLGLWTSGPFLHNGSVRTVYEVISPPRERESGFWIGDRRVDPEKLGFVSTESPDHFFFDTTLPGNGNGGHDFWSDAPLSEDDRLAIIEYLKDPEQFPIERQ